MKQISEMVSPTSMELTEDEAELYDRQIRLWGLDSQKRLRSSKVLIVGLKGFGAEVAKNIILSGVKSVTLLDGELFSEEDKCSQFLAPHDSVNTPRAAASLARAQALNPMVEVTADIGKVSDKPDAFFTNFDVVVATECQMQQLHRINTACRLSKVKFFCGDVFGLFGYIFADLNQHEFVEEVIHYAPTTEGGKTKIKPIKCTEKRKETMCPLVDALSVNWTTSSNSKRMTKMDYTYPLMMVLQEFRNTHGRNPDHKQREADINLLESISKSILTRITAPLDKIPSSALGLVFGEVSPTCAILGGVLGQEVIKAVSGKEAPLNNFFFFNPELCLGFVDTFSVA